MRGEATGLSVDADGRDEGPASGDVARATALPLTFGELVCDEGVGETGTVVGGGEEIGDGDCGGGGVGFIVVGGKA